MELGLGELVGQVGVARGWGGGWLVEGGVVGFGAAELAGEVGEPVPDRGAELAAGVGVEVVVVAVFELVEEVGLAAAQVLDVPGEPGAAGGGVAVGRWALGVELVGEQVAAVRAEDAGGEEAVDGGEQGVLADPDARGVGGVPGPVGVVAGVGLAGEVGVALAGLAEHPPAAGVVGDVGAQQVGAFGLRVDVGCGAGPGALLAAGVCER